MKRGELIRLRRNEKNLTQRALGQKLGLNTSSISRYEGDKFGKMDPDLADRMALLLDLDPQLLIEPGEIAPDDVPQSFITKESELYEEQNKGEKLESLFAHAKKQPQIRIKLYEKENFVTIQSQDTPPPDWDLKEISLPVAFYEQPERIASGIPDQFVHVRTSTLSSDYTKYFALPAKLFDPKAKVPFCIFEISCEIEPHKKQLIEMNGKRLIGIAKQLNDVLAIRTEDEEGLYLFDLKKEPVKILGTLIEN